MATVPLGAGMGQFIAPSGFLAPTVQIRGAAGRLRSARVAANEIRPALAFVAQRAPANSNSDENSETEETPDRAKSGKDAEHGAAGEASARKFGGVEQVGPDLTREEEEAAIEGGWGD